ncbi:hypothetical protein NBRC116494_01100 [Aurantivibrio plasticivorans]
MRDGLPIDSDISSRMEFIATNRTLWTLSWFAWMLSALGLFIFCTIFANKLRSSPLKIVGLAFVGMGIAPDLIAEVNYAFIIPEILVNGADEQTFLTLETLSIYLTGFLGNGLYNLGGVVLTISAIRQGLIRSWVAIWGVTAWILGLLLSLSIAIGSMAGAELFTASSMVLSTLWMLIFAHKVANH